MIKLTRNIAILTLMGLLSACSGGGGGGTSNPNGPTTSAGTNTNIVIDPVKLEQPDLGRVTSTTPVNSFLNIRNTGSGLISPVNVSLTGIDASFFSLSGTCPDLQPDGGNVCTVQVLFNPAGKLNRIYMAQLDVNGVKFPLSVELAVQSSGVSDYQIYQNSEYVANTIDLGKTETAILQQTVLLKHLLRSASGNLPIIMTDSNFQLSRTSCPAVEINKTGCPITITFNPTDKASRVYSTTLKVGSGNPIPINVNLKAEKQSGQAMADFHFYENDVKITNYSFGTITIPEKKKVTLTIKNEGLGAGVPNLNIIPNQIYMIGSNSCNKTLQPNETCVVDIYATSLNRLANYYNSKLMVSNNSITLNTFVYKTNQCSAGTHLDPDSLLCLSDKQTEIVANGTRTRTWMPAPLPGNWEDWTYSCLEPKFELNDLANACIPKRRNLTLEIEGGGTLTGAVGGIYDFDTVVTLRANPAQYYMFKEWLGGTCSGSTNTCTVTMNQHHTVRAVFYIPPLQITPNPIQVLINSGITLTTTGGIPPYHYEMAQDALGSINPTSGVYSGFSTPTQGAVRVRDSDNRVVDVSLKVARPLSAPTGVFNVTTNSNSVLGATDGFPPYTFVKNSGVGTPGEGVYNTGAVPGTAFVTITDGLGHQKNVNINVVHPLTVSPTAIASEVGKNIALSISEGITPYTIQLLGVGTAEPVGSLLGQTYRTGTVPGQSIIRITDSMNNVVDVPVVVVPTFTLAQSPKPLVFNSSWTIGVEGGLGPFTYEQLSGPGVTSATGVFTSFETSGQAVIRVTDSLGTSYEQIVNVYQPLNIGFTNLKMLVGQQKTIIPTGGVGPFTVTIKSGSGNISGGNTYSSSVVTTAVIKVVDGVGFQEVEGTIEVLPEFKLPTTNVNLIAGATYQIIPTGGATPYAYELLIGNGSVDATGFYSSSPLSGTDVIQVRDSLGNTIDLNVNVVLPLSLTTTTPNIYVNQTANLIASQGLPPYTYRISNGSGSVNNSGVFTAGPGATVATVEVTDAMGSKATHNISVYGTFAASPLTKNLITNSTQQISASGGKSPYTYNIISGSGSVSSSGLFTAGAAGDITIEVKDSLTAVETLNFKVVTPLEITPNVGVVVLTSDSKQFTPSGGLPPYTYTLTQGVGSITQSGNFLAQGTAGQSQIQIADAMGSTKRVNIEVINPLTVPEENIITTVNKSLVINPAGGLPPYSYTKVSGLGTITSSGAYTAASSPGTDIIKVTDSSGLGLEKTITIEVKEGISLIAPSPYITINQSQTYSATGGLPPYTYSMLSGRGTIDPNSGLYQSGSLEGDGFIQVFDALGNTDETIIQVLGVLDLNIPGGGMVVNQSKTISGVGGLAPYTYEIVTGGGTLSGANYTAPGSAGSVTLKVKDALNQEVQKIVGIHQVLSIVDNNFENVVNQNYQVQVTGGLTPYEYFITSGPGTISSIGIHTSPTAGSVTIKVIDALGQEVDISGTIYSSLSITPQNSTVVFFEPQIFQGVGGKLPYTYEKVSGVGVLTGNEYLADQAGTAQIKVTDSLGQTFQTSITVNSNITISAGSCSYEVPETVSCFVGSTGGIGDRVYSTDVGTINPSTGEFKGLCINNLGQSVVTVTDTQGNFKTLNLSYPCVYKGCSQILADGLGTVSGLYWLDNDTTQAPDPVKGYCDMTGTEQGGWLLVSSNNTDSSLLPLGLSRQSTNYELDRATTLGTPSPETDYIIGSSINTLSWQAVKIVGFGRNQVGNASINYSNRGNWAAAIWSVGATGSARLSTITPKSSVTISGNTAINTLANYYVVDAMKMDRLVGGFNANKDQTTIGAAGVQNASGDPQGGTYFGHGSAEESSYGEGWYDASGPANSKGWTTWVKDIYHKHPRSCLDALQRGMTNQLGNTSSGIYTIDPDGYNYGVAPFTVYCDQITDSGGWTLVMKQASGDGTTLQGDVGYWTNINAGTLNDSVAYQSENNVNFVSKAFTTIPVTDQLMLKAANESTRKYKSGTYNSAWASFQSVAQYSDDCNSLKPNWFIYATHYPNASAITSSRFDFNYMQNYNGTPVMGARWGWTTNENGCGSAQGSHDAGGGLGVYGPNYGGTWMNNNKGVWQPATLYLYIR